MKQVYKVFTGPLMRLTRPLAAAFIGLSTLVAAAGCRGGPADDPAAAEVTTSSAPLGVTADLSNINQGDFTIGFTLATSQSTGVVGVLGQRASCAHGDFWDIRLQDGNLIVETDDGTNYTALSSALERRGALGLADGAPRMVEVERASGTLTILIDGLASGSASSLASFGTLAPTSAGVYGCVNVDGTVPFAGTLASSSVNGAPPFANDLSNIHVAAEGDAGSGNFTINFQLATSQNTGSVGVIGQRASCAHGDFWDIRLQDGNLIVETDDGTNYTALSSAVGVADGALHNVLVNRANGTLTISVDGVASGSAVSFSSFGALAPVSTGLYGCVNVDGTVPLAGTLVSTLRE